MSHIQDLQDAIFFQIIESIKSNDLQNIDDLVKKIGNYSNKIHYYSHTLRDLLSTMFGPHHINDDVGKFCSFLFKNGLTNASYFIYCLASHDHYVNGFSFGFVKHYIHDHWCYSSDKFLDIKNRDIKKLRELFSLLDMSQISKVTENIHHIIQHLSYDHFKELVSELRNCDDFLISEVTPQFIIELLYHNDEILIDFVIFEILNENHYQKKKIARHLLHKSTLDNFEIGLLRINYLLLETMKILYTMYNHYIQNLDFRNADLKLTLAKRLIAVILNIFKDPTPTEQLFIHNFYESLERIKLWTEVVDPLRIKLIEYIDDRMDTAENIDDSKMSVDRSSDYDD